MGLKTCRAKAFLEATGDAKAVGLAGLELIRSDVVQPATLTFGCSGYDLDALCFASDCEANSALRVECPCMAMGQASGTMAALSDRTGVNPVNLSLDDVRGMLQEHGAIVPGSLRFNS